jgi:hypothetical protein
MASRFVMVSAERRKSSLTLLLLLRPKVESDPESDPIFSAIIAALNDVQREAGYEEARQAGHAMKRMAPRCITASAESRV